MENENIVIGRAIHSISLNGLEFLMEQGSGYKEFNDEEEAKSFIRAHIFPDSTDEEIHGYFTFMTAAEALDYEEQKEAQEGLS